jgi:transmembrane sensor
MQKQEIQELSEKITAGTASAEEIKLYNRLCNYFDSTEEEWDEHLFGNKKEIEQQIKKGIWKQVGLEKPVYKMRWFKWVAAASVMLMVYSGYLLVTKNVAKTTFDAVKSPVKKELPDDIAPGQTGAILTLASGEKIILDSAENGSLAEQGNVAVVKKDGELIYKTEGKNIEAVYNTITTPKGRQFNLVLADGSKAWLNSASSITFPTAFVGAERKIIITGEAYFEVAHNASMPFIVESGKNVVRVLGTHFNINAYDNEKVVSVTLLQGSVDVSRGNVSKIIKPGQQAQINSEEKINLVRDVDLNHVVAWKNGRISFQGADLGTVMRQMSRWYDVDIEYNSKVNDLFYADMARSTMLSDVLKALELTTDVRFKIEGRKVIVVP